MDIVKITAQCSEELGGNKTQEAMKECFCEKFIDELKKIDAKELAKCYVGSTFIVAEKKTRVTFLF